MMGEDIFNGIDRTVTPDGAVHNTFSLEMGMAKPNYSFEKRQKELAKKKKKEEKLLKKAQKGAAGEEGGEDETTEEGADEAVVQEKEPV